MELKDYSVKAASTMMPSCQNFSYLFGNLKAEVGEASEESNLIGTKLADECGDVWWQITMQMNINNLSERAKNNEIATHN